MSKMSMRLLCLLLCMAFPCPANAETANDQALADLAGTSFEDTITDDTSADETISDGTNADGTVGATIDNSTWTEQTYVAPSIDTDADLVLGYVADVNCEINPFLCTGRDLVSLNQLVFESVIELDEDGKPSPLLADSWSVDGNVWTFTLREGIVFHNGYSLTAYEVVSSYQRFLLAGSDNPYYTRLQMIESMEAKDDLTLEVTSKYSGYITLYAMTFPVVQSSTLDDSMPRGTGPYWYTQYAPGSGVRLENNPLWWKKDPEIQSIAAINYADSGEALEALSTNRIDILCTQSSHAAFTRKISDYTDMDYVTNVYEMLVPNLDESSVMSELNIRRAVMYAIDRSELADKAYLGMGIQCEVPVNPSTWLYESQSAIFYYSPERALQLLKNCGWSDVDNDGVLNQVDGVRLKDLEIDLITYNESTNSVRENAANMIASYLGTVGVKVNVSVVSKARAEQRIKDGEYDLALVGVQLSDVPGATSILKKKGALNLNGYSSETMETLAETTTTAADDVSLKSAFSSMQMQVVEELPILGLLFRTGTVLSRRSLAGLSGISASNMLNGIEFMEKE